jgi:alkylation response protein AidB-like acyl-CoA dehydrogenase
MAENFYLDNSDIKFNLKSIGLDDVVFMREHGYTEFEKYPYAPVDFDDAIDSYDKVLAMFGEICGEMIAPRAAGVDEAGCTLEKGKVSYAPGTDLNLKDLRDAQVMGATLPRRYGGLNMPVTLYTMMNEMVSRADCSLQNLFGLQDIADTINKFANEDQKSRYLPRFASGEVDGAMALTEPEAGSDLQAVQLKATYDKAKNIWYLNGMKRFITNGCAKVHLVLARSEEGTKDGRGLSMFVCESGPQLVVRRIEDKMGIHGSPTCELQFNNVPAELVGERRRGLTRYIMSLMNGARVAISAQALGVAEAAYRNALKYAHEREQFGKPIIKFPAVYEMLVSARVRIAAGRALLYETTKYVDLRDIYEERCNHADTPNPEDRQNEKKYTKIAAVLTPLAKAYLTELGNQVAYDGIQIMGGTGFMRDFPAERYYRDVRITNIYEGTTQLQYVAAIGGVMLRTMDPLMADISKLPFEGKLRRLASAVDMGHEKLVRAVKAVEARKDSAYHDLMARRLCEMETIVFCSYLLLRGALQDKSREVLAERYIQMMLPILDAHAEVVLKGDAGIGIIDSYETVLAM